MVKQYQSITLDDGNVYFVLETIDIEHIHYLYLMKQDNTQYFAFYKEVEQDGDTHVIAIADEIELRKVQIAILDKMRQTIENKNNI